MNTRGIEVKRLFGEALRAKADAVDDAFLSAVRDGADDGKASRGKGGRARMKRAGRPGVPKTFGSRSR